LQIPPISNNREMSNLPTNESPVHDAFSRIARMSKIGAITNLRRVLFDATALSVDVAALCMDLLDTLESALPVFFPNDPLLTFASATTDVPCSKDFCFSVTEHVPNIVKEFVRPYTIATPTFCSRGDNGRVLCDYPPYDFSLEMDGCGFDLEFLPKYSYEIDDLTELVRDNKLGPIVHDHPTGLLMWPLKGPVQDTGFQLHRKQDLQKYPPGLYFFPKCRSGSRFRILAPISLVPYIRKKVDRSRAWWGPSPKPITVLPKGLSHDRYYFYRRLRARKRRTIESHGYLRGASAV